MPILWSDHARHQLQERNLSPLEVERAIRKPSRVTRQAIGRYCAVRRVGRRKKPYLLVVIYDTHGQTKEIVTAFITSKINKYL